MGAHGTFETQDPKVIPIGPWLRPHLVVDTSPTDSKVIPLRPELLPRSVRGRRTPRFQAWLAGISWVAVALL